MIGTLLNVPLLPLIFFFLQPVRGRGPPPYTPCWKPEIRLTNRPTYLSQPEVVPRVSRRSEMSGTARGRRLLALIALKELLFLAFLANAKIISTFQVRTARRLCAAATPNLSQLTGASYHRARRTAAVTRARGKTKPLLVKTECLPTYLPSRFVIVS